ncbi:MAG: cyclic nucleotide-binding domain-containing protein [Chlamydiia bacterium]|nr:cyclic nucleotide-binding domain-containing protein [Chlamydiia bacterium]
MDHPYFKIFSQCALFKGLKHDEIKHLFLMSEEMTVEKDQVLIHEGEKAKELFIVIEGDLEILKIDPEMDVSHALDVIRPGQVVGDLSFLDRGYRSASVQAKTFARLRKLSYADLHAWIEESPLTRELGMRVAENIAKKLRHMNHRIAQTIRSEIKEANVRATMGVFLMAIVTIISVFIYGLSGLQYLLKIVPNSTFISFPLTIAMGSILVLMMQYFRLQLYDLGISARNWKKSLLEGFFFTLPVLGLAVGVKWFLIHYLPFFHERPFFDPYALIQNPANQNWSYWGEINFMYAFLIVPLQELLTRGCLQGLLEKFLTGKRRVLSSILMSNLIFSSTHVFFSVYLAFAVFLVGCFLGFLYSRSHNLLGCCLSHAMMGVFGLSILGITGSIFE